MTKKVGRRDAKSGSANGSEQRRREEAVKRIRQNIRRSGYHVYLITGGPHPRFAYTIGLCESIGVELLLGGATLYMADDVQRVIARVRARLADGSRLDDVFELEELGAFTLRPLHKSWTLALMFGALDYYQTLEIPAFQLVPDAAHSTLDVPDMSVPWSPGGEPPWRWLREAWPHAVPAHTTVLTNLAALRGSRITAVSRWDGDEWEMFAGSPAEIAPAEARVVPLGVLLAADASLLPVLELEAGQGLWRDDADGEWLPWGAGRKS